MEQQTIDKMEKLMRYADFDLRRTHERYGAGSREAKDALAQFGVAWLALKKLRSQDEFLADVC